MEHHSSTQNKEPQKTGFIFKVDPQISNEAILSKLGATNIPLVNFRFFLFLIF